MDIVRHQFRPTDTIELPHPRLRLHAKLELENPTGSAKDRSAYWILREAVRRGEITGRSTVVESSSGNFALSLARFCRRLGVSFVPVLDPNANALTERTLRSLCDRVEKVETRDPTGGFLLSRLDRVAELVDEVEDVYWTNQYANLDGAQGHYELTGPELVEAVGRIDYLFVGVGTGATVAGLSRRVKESSPRAKVVAVDVEGSAIFGAKPHRRLIPGIGSSIRPPMIEDALVDEVVTISELDEVTGCRRLLAEHEIFAGGSTGGVFTAIDRYFVGYHGPPPVVAFLCVDRGEPYRSTVYDDDWVAANLTPAETPSAVAAG